MKTTLYMLQYDVDYGDRENWNVFYTPCEVFDSAEARMKRVEYIMANSDEYVDLEENFLMTEVELMADLDYNAPIKDSEWRADDEDEDEEE